MCGRFLILTDEDYNEIMKIVTAVSERYRESEVVKGEAFPTNNVPVVYSHKGKNILSAAKWGFPKPQNEGLIINARAETVHEKPMFRQSFVSRRCLVPANGYYEWLAEKGKKTKTKYFIRVKEKRLFYMAGLYNMFTDKSGNTYPAITIITTAASPDIEFIHDRMPVILRDEALNIWLDQSNRDVNTLRNLLVPYQAGELKYEAV